MLTKINVLRIIRDHFKTLSDGTTGEVYFSDYLLFIGIPILFAAFSFIVKIEMGENLINLLVTSLSIFAALLFNLLLLVYDIVQKRSKEGEMNKEKAKLLKETFSNISFSILVSIITVILLVILDCGITTSCIIQLLHTIIIFLITMFMITLLMILKRIHILLSKEFEDKKIA